MKLVRSRHSERGVALLTALALLFLFSMLGAAFVRSISIDLERTQAELAEVRAISFAQGGFEAAVGVVASSLAAGETPPVLGVPVEIPYPVFESDKGSATGIRPDDSAVGRATFTVTDESGKINLNHASPRVLQSVLGVPGRVAREIRASLPLPDAGGSPANRAWFTSINELKTRGLAPEALFNKINPGLVTVYSVADHGSAGEYLNVNAAPPQVLAAVLDIPPDAAEELASQKPFENLQQLCEAAGKDPALFNGVTGSEPGAGFGNEIGFQSRCFRIVSEGVVARVGGDGGEYRPVRRRIEAVVVFDRLAGPQITYWNEGAGAGDPPAA